MKNRCRIFIPIVLMLLVILNLTFSYAYWASLILADNVDGDGNIIVGIWVPTGYDYGITQTGSEGDNFIRFEDIRNDLTAKYIVLTDIDFNAYPYNNETEYPAGWFTPIGWNSTIHADAFQGEINGNKKTIKNLYLKQEYIGSSYKMNTAVFNQVSPTGVIENLTLEDTSVEVNFRDIEAEEGRLTVTASVLVGTNNGIVRNILSIGTVIKTTFYDHFITSGTDAQIDLQTGALVGVNKHKIENVHLFDTNLDSDVYRSTTATSPTTHSANRSGGIVGVNDSSGEITNSSSSGELVANNRNDLVNSSNSGHLRYAVGGITGTNSGTITNVFSKMTLTAKSTEHEDHLTDPKLTSNKGTSPQSLSIGGITGLNTNAGSSISQAVYTGNLIIESHRVQGYAASSLKAGGIIGEYAAGSLTKALNYGYMQVHIIYDNSSVPAIYIAGLVAINNSGTVTNSLMAGNYANNHNSGSIQINTTNVTSSLNTLAFIGNQNVTGGSNTNKLRIYQDFSYRINSMIYTYSFGNPTSYHLNLTQMNNIDPIVSTEFLTTYFDWSDLDLWDFTNLDYANQVHPRLKSREEIVI